MAGLSRQVEDATNILLEEPPMSQGRETCTSLLVEQVSDASVLFVSYTRGADECVANLPDPDAHDKVGVVTVGDAGGGVAGSDVVTENVSTASDLTGLGIQIGQFLSEWESPVYLCFDSLTSMLQYVDFETAYEFLHAIKGRIFAADARAHFHIDPRAHDGKHVAGITALFDASISLEDDVVRKREVLET